MCDLNTEDSDNSQVRHAVQENQRKLKAQVYGWRNYWMRQLYWTVEDLFQTVCKAFQFRPVRGKKELEYY